MNKGVRLGLIGAALLLVLASCGRSFLQTGERESWRHQAEVACLKSGEVKTGTGVVQISPIEGPGMCGADFPFKVSMLGEGSALTSYAEDPRPPGAIPGSSPGSSPNSSATPGWPPNQPSSQPPYARPNSAPPAQPVRGETLRWTPGPAGIDQRAVPAVEQPRYAPNGPDRYAPPVEQQRYAPPLQEPRYVPPAEMRTPGGQPMSIYAPDVQQPDDIPDDAILPPGRTPTGNPRATYNAPNYEPPRQRVLPSLGPMRGPQSAALATPATLNPPATLACPLVSALDKWVSGSVQPAALRWFGAPVTEIKQISAYSCRSMVGAGTSHISEHAFGNALDIAGFVLSDGRKITVREGWHGAAEEQGFLRDVHMAACDYFSTVLAPGYNAAHYDHIHVDLMRRASGRHPCRPDALPGDVAAAKARTMYASRHRGTTGSVALQDAKSIMGIPGEDGEFDDDEPAPAATSGWPRPAPPKAAAPAISAPDTTDVTGSIPAAPPAPARPRSAGDAAIRLQEMRDAH